MSRYKSTGPAESEATVIQCDTTTQPPAVESQTEQPQTQSNNYSPEVASNQRPFHLNRCHDKPPSSRYKRRQGDDRPSKRLKPNPDQIDAILGHINTYSDQIDAISSHVNTHSSQINTHSGHTHTHSQQQLSPNTSEDVYDDFSSDDESRDPMHQLSYQMPHALGGQIDTDKSFPMFQDLSGSRSKVPEDVRLRINSRERQRMHDLNSALDSLRQVMPYSSGPSVKKLSKMSTLLLARNYIVMLTRSLEEMKRLVQEMPLARRPLPPASLPTPTAATVSSPHQPIASSLSSLPLLSSSAIYAALLSSHASASGGFLIPAPFVQAPHLMPAASLTHHHHHHSMPGLLPCGCYYCKKPISSVPSS